MECRDQASGGRVELSKISFHACDQAAFHVFGMELLCQLDLAATKAFFTTFFRLPPSYWRGFLASSLSSTQLLTFALLTFVLAPPSIQAKLVTHLLTHPAGKYLVQRYAGSTGACMLGRGVLVCPPRVAQGRLPWRLRCWRCWQRVMGDDDCVCLL